MNDPLLYGQSLQFARWCRRKMRRYLRGERRYLRREQEVTISRALTEFAARYRRVVAPLVPLVRDRDQAAHICDCLCAGVRANTMAKGIERYIQETIDASG
jgi:hypothetical protein